MSCPESFCSTRALAAVKSVLPLPSFGTASVLISLTAVEGQVRTALQQPDLELVAVNVPDEKKGEQIVLLVAGQVDYETVKAALLAGKSNPLMIPSLLIDTEAIPKLGTGKTDFNAAKALVLQKLSEQDN